MENDRLGLLLDLETGKLKLYVNDQCRGILNTDIISGEYCSAVTISNNPFRESDKGEMYWEESTIGIEGAPIPE